MRGIRAGKLTIKVGIYSIVATQDGSGQAVESKSLVRDEFCFIENADSRYETFLADRKIAFDCKNFWFRELTWLTNKHVVKYNNQYYNIKAIIQEGIRQRWTRAYGELADA